MAKPYEISKRFKELPPNIELLNKLYRKNQKDYIRKRFKAIKWLWEGKSSPEVVEKLDINRNSLTDWLKILIEHGVEEGLKLLAKPKTAKKTGKLNDKQQASLLEILENKKPTDYGYEQNIFTGDILVKLVEKLWQIKLSTQSIYNTLHRNKFSYQRGHRDYDNADPKLQQAYAEDLKKTLENKADDEKIVFFDEFSVTNRPTTFYGWARVNTKFSVPSNEKKRETA
jgi:transposase